MAARQRAGRSATVPETIGGACLGVGAVQLAGLAFWADFTWVRLLVGLALLLAGVVLLGFVARRPTP